jgi:hypothetical protein
VAAGGEVVAQRRELHVPDGENVALVVAAGFADPDKTFKERKKLDPNNCIIYNNLTGHCSSHENTNNCAKEIYINIP